MKGLTTRQRAVLRFVRTYQETHGFQPTVREMGTALGIRSTNGVNDHLFALAAKGYIARAGAKARALVLLKGEDGQSLTPLPAPKPTPRCCPACGCHLENTT